MPLPIGAIGLGLAGASAATNIIRGFNQPEFPITAADINREIDLQLNRALSETASGVRRRLIGAGMEGSGAIDTRITDAQNRIRQTFEEKRVQALNMLRQAQYGADVQSYENLTNILGDLSGIGFSSFLLGSNALNPGGAFSPLQSAPKLNFPQISQAGMNAGLTSGSIF